MTMGVGSICFSCQRFRSWLEEGAPTTDKGPNAFCAAFPGGIPDEIIYNGFDHRNPLGTEQTDDSGNPILFQLDPARGGQLKAYEEAVREPTP